MKEETAVYTCPECQDQGTIPCEYCFAGAYEPGKECPHCDGYGDTPCPFCQE